MREVIEIKEIQSILLPILEYIDKVCKDNNLRYSLAFGTLIGAIRHKGFIPWDDDIDIVMPRTDFDKLIEILEKEQNKKYKILSPYDTNSFFAGQMLKVYDAETKLCEFPNKYNLEYGAYIDVFPIDGIDNSIVKARKYHKKYDKYRKILHILSAYRFRKKNDIKRKIASLLKPLLKKYVNECSIYHHKYDYEKSNKIALLVQTSTFEKDLYEKVWFENLIDVDFENNKFKIFARYDECLRRYYGDYMKLPPKEKRVSHHDFKLYKK